MAGKRKTPEPQATGPTPWETYKAQVEADARKERDRLIAEARNIDKNATGTNYAQPDVELTTVKP